MGEKGYKLAFAGWLTSHQEEFSSAISDDIAKALGVDSTAVTIVSVKTQDYVDVEFEIEDSDESKVEQVAHLNGTSIKLDSVAEVYGKPVNCAATKAVQPDPRRCKGDKDDSATAQKLVANMPRSVMASKALRQSINMSDDNTTVAKAAVQDSHQRQKPAAQTVELAALTEKKVPAVGSSNPVKPLWLNWTEWSTCSKVCGGGNKIRTRVCKTPPGHSEMGCLGPSQQLAKCNTHCCPVMGQYSEWTQWSECSKTCGGGMQFRSRLCDGAKCGGRCYGQKTEARSCNNFCCPIDSEFLEEAGNYSKCSQDCGGGLRFRVKPATPPRCGGKHVSEHERVDSKGCNLDACNVDGGWSAWEPWEKCTEPKQQVTRQRFCNAPHARGAGQPCKLTRYLCSGPTVTDRTCKVTSSAVDVQTETRLCNHDWERTLTLEAAQELDTELEAISDA